MPQRGGGHSLPPRECRKVMGHNTPAEGGRGVTGSQHVCTGKAGEEARKLAGGRVLSFPGTG